MPSELREPPVHRRHRSGSREDGAVAVETAVVSMFLIILLMGIIEASFFFKNWSTVTASSRAGARMGSSQSKSPTFGTTTADQVTNSISGLPPESLSGVEVWVFDANKTTGLPTSTGVVPSGTNCTDKCLKYIWSAGSAKLVATGSGTWPSSVQNACIGHPLRSSLGVYVQFPHHSPLGFIFTNKVVAESTVMWLEPFTPSTGCST